MSNLDVKRTISFVEIQVGGPLNIVTEILFSFLYFPTIVSRLAQSV